MKPVVLAAALLAALWCGAAYAQNQNSVRDDVPALGSHIRKTVSTWSLPLRKSYEQFSEAEKDLVRGQYEPTPYVQDPPFPKKGLGTLLVKLKKISENLGEQGDLDMVFTIDKMGVPQSVDVLKAPSQAFARYAAALVMATPFKAATCDGQACEMQFPLRVNFVLEP